MIISEYVDSLRTKIQDNISDLPIIRLGRLSNDDKAISLRIMPSNSLKFYDNDKSINLSLQVLSKSKSQLEALRMAEKVTKYLDDEGMRIIQEPSYLDEDEQGYIYMAIVRKEIN